MKEKKQPNRNSTIVGQPARSKVLYYVRSAVYSDTFKYNLQNESERMPRAYRTAIQFTIILLINPLHMPSKIRFCSSRAQSYYC